MFMCADQIMLSARKKHYSDEKRIETKNYAFIASGYKYVNGSSNIRFEIRRKCIYPTTNNNFRKCPGGVAQWSSLRHDEHMRPGSNPARV
jgi:hypothetical protein